MCYRKRLLEPALVLLAAISLTVVMTWPIAPRLSSVGRVDSTDAMYSMWNVAWVARTAVSDPLNIFDANIFYPHRSALAFSESNLLTGVLGIPVWLLTNNVYATYNSVILFGFLLSLICTYALVRRLTGSRLGAAVAAIGFAFCPYVYARFPHIQLQMTFGMPLSLLALHRLADRPSALRGAALGGALAIQGLTCAYYGVLAGLSVAMGVIVLASSRSLWRTRAYWLGVAAGFVVCASIITIAFLPYLTLQDAGFQRSLEEARRYSYGWRSWLASPAKAHLWMLPWLRSIEWRGGVLFPGFVTLIAGVAGLMLATRAKADPRRTRETAILYTLIGLLALWLSLGPDAGLYTALYYALPPFQLLRAPERFGIEVTLVLAVGSGFAAAWVSARLQTLRGRRLALVAAAAMLVLSVADKWIAPLTFRPSLPVPQPYASLAALPKGPVAEFPYFLRPSSLHRNAEYMLFSTYHWQPLLNGYSDHVPAGFHARARAISTFPSTEEFSLLGAEGARYVMVHLHYYHHVIRPQVEQALAAYVSDGALRLLDRDTQTNAEGRVTLDVALYEIRKSRISAD